MARITFKFDSGSIPSAAAVVLGNAANYLAINSRNWLVTGLNRLVGYKGPLLLNGVEGGKVMMAAAEGYASLGTTVTDGLGSVFRVLTALFFIGAGAVRYNGLATGAVATSTLSLRLLENGLYNGTTLQAGLAQPSAPSIFAKTAGAGFTGTKLGNGTHSIEIWRIRSSTGAISVASLPSNVIVTASGQTLVATFPLPSANGDDRWGVATPKTGFGEFGPFYEIRDISEIAESEIATTELTDGAMTATDTELTSASATFTTDDVGKEIIVFGADTAGADLLTTIASWNSATSVELTDPAVTTVVATTVQYNGIVDGVLRSVELEWTDGQLAGMGLAPIDDFPPPPALYGGTLNDTGFLDGAYGDVGAGVDPATLGATIAVSLPLKFESWPPDSLLFAPQPVTALSSRAADGYAYRAGASTLGALIYTGGDPPISFQLRWPNSGCLSPNNMVIAEEGRLYIWTAQHGLARIGDSDEPETEFAIPIWDEVSDWNAEDVAMGWDGENRQVCACYQKLIKPFNSQIERWGTLLDLTGKVVGNIISCVTAPGGEMYLCCDDGATLRLYRFNAGTGMVSEAYTPWIQTAGESDQVFGAGGTVVIDDKSDPVTLRLLANGDQANIAREWQIHLPKQGQDYKQQLYTQQPNLINAQSHALYAKVIGHGGFTSLDFLYSDRESDETVIQG